MINEMKFMTLLWIYAETTETYGVPIYHIMDGLNINKISKHLNK